MYLYGVPDGGGEAVLKRGGLLFHFGVCLPQIFRGALQVRLRLFEHFLRLATGVRNLSI